jgi:hypothetical protein
VASWVFIERVGAGSGSRRGSSGGGSRVSAANPPSAETLLDRVVARLGEVAPAFDTQGLLAVTVIRFDTPEWASFQGAEQFKSASVVKALWVAAALDHAGVEAGSDRRGLLYGSSNDAAGAPWTSLEASMLSTRTPTISDSPRPPPTVALRHSAARWISPDRARAQSHHDRRPGGVLGGGRLRLALGRKRCALS